MHYTNVTVNAPGQAPILANGIATSGAAGLSCRDFAPGHLPTVGTRYTIHAIDAAGRMIPFEGYRCVAAGPTSTFAA